MTRHPPLSLLLAVSLCLLMPARTATSQDATGSERGNYTIGPGDDLHVVVWRNEELTMNVPVRPDGWISLPLVDDVKVEGLTPMQVREHLAGLLEEFITAPIISIIVTRVGSFKVSILGNVRNPGRFDLEGRPTVLDVLALAGGPDEFADTGGIYILRTNGDAVDKLPVPYASATQSEDDAKDEGTNLRVRPGDIVVVP